MRPLRPPGRSDPTPNANNIPPLTQYAADNWPRHPEEFYAEAYSLWLSDRTYLQTNAPTLVTFFDSGGHR